MEEEIDKREEPERFDWKRELGCEGEKGEIFGERMDENVRWESRKGHGQDHGVSYVKIGEEFDKETRGIERERGRVEMRNEHFERGGELHVG